MEAPILDHRGEPTRVLQMLIADLLHLDSDQRITHRWRNELVVAVQEEVRVHLGRSPDLFLIGPGRLLHEFPRVDGYGGESELRLDDPASARLCPALDLTAR